MKHYIFPQNGLFRSKIMSLFKDTPQQLEEWLDQACSKLPISTFTLPILLQTDDEYPKMLFGKTPNVLFYQGNLGLLKNKSGCRWNTKMCSVQGIAYAIIPLKASI